jgi:hypothetical protein
MALFTVLIYSILFLCLADNSYQGLRSHSNQFSIDLSNPIHIEVKTGEKHLVNEVLDNKDYGEIWKTPRAPGR